MTDSPPPRGVHILAELHGCDPARLDDHDLVVAAVRRAAEAARAAVLDVSSHRFHPHGVTALALLAESHLSIHTWPEHGYAAVDALTCGATMRPQDCVDLLGAALGATDVATTVVERGATPRWFTERELPYCRTGVRVEVEIGAVLHDERSRFGHIQVFDTPFHGRMLVLDGVIQTTVNDEFIYHEMLVLAPSLEHGAPRSMLIVGGGDGGALRQALRLRSLDRVVQVEIDETVTRVCRDHLPEISAGAFDDPRVELVFADGAEYVAGCSAEFDVIVLDLTDPVSGSPAERLFDEAFLGQARDALAPGGVLAMQCGSLTLQPAEVRTQLRRLGEVFAATRLHTAVVPGYQLTTFGFLLGSATPLTALDGPDADLAERWRNIAGDCEYLSPEMYRASSALPPYLRRILQV